MGHMQFVIDYTLDGQWYCHFISWITCFPFLMDPRIMKSSIFQTASHYFTFLVFLKKFITLLQHTTNSDAIYLTNFFTAYFTAEYNLYLFLIMVHISFSTLTTYRMYHILYYIHIKLCIKRKDHYSLWFSNIVLTISE